MDDGDFAKAKQHFDSAMADDEETVRTIAEVYDATEYLLDPHSAIGVSAARQVRRDKCASFAVGGARHEHDLTLVIFGILLQRGTDLAKLVT